MSAAAGSANKANVYSEENEALYDPYSLFTISSHYTEIPWPEWNDAELNTEAWDEGKGRAATAAGGKKEIAYTPPSLFDDPNPPSLPLFIKKSVFSWKRPQEVFENVTLTLYEPTNSEFELIVPSPAADCDFFKTFNEQLPILQYYASKYGFPVELETPKYVANTQGETWRPWHHIYALCKAGKGQVHKPLYCPYGKYVVRIFYMGSWRKFIVDDKIPCDKDGKCMLPTSKTLGELWPIILAKALLKIVSLTPTYDLCITDFPMLSFFTGWMQGTFSGVNKTVEQIWRRLSALLPCYELPDEAAEQEAKSVVAHSAKNLASKKESRPGTDKKDSQTEKFCFILAAMEGFSCKENLYDDYTIGVTMIRDRPLAKVNKREGTKPWKRIRWVYWAKEKGLWMDETLMPPYRRIQNITFVKEILEFLTPDPKQESTLYETPTEVEDSEAEYLGEDTYFEPEQWCDFLKFRQHLSRIYVFFKPSFLKCNYKVTCLKEKNTETVGSGKSTGKVPPPPQNFFPYPPTLKQTCNEPLFLFCESSSGIFLGISISVSPKKPKSGAYYLEEKQPEVLRIVNGTLIIEKYLWETYEQGEIIGMVKTVGNSSILLNLNPGRHILKLWLSCDSPYVIDMYSNVGVIVHKNSRIRHLMKSESEGILNYITNVSNAFIALTLKFGKPDLPSALRNFYNAIKPGNDGILDYRRKIDDFIETFLNCILLSLKNAITNTDEVKIMMWALQSLFFNPNIRCDLPSGDPPVSIFGGVKKQPPKKEIPLTAARTLSEILDYPWCSREIAQIVLIQSVFRGFRVRLLWKCQAPARKEFKPYVERLKKICDTLFVPPKREQEVGMLLRRILIAKPDLLTTFRFHKDFYNVIQVEEFAGKVPNVEPFAWVPITRFVVACHSENAVPCAIYLSCNLENFVIQGFDNDTNKEIFRLTNNVSPHYFRNNVRGYTIFAFGWNEANVKTVNWKLELVRVKYFQAIHPCNFLVDFTCRPYPLPSLEILEIRNFYIPNSKNRVCRCFIKIQKRTLLTLRFSASYAKAHFVVTIFLDKNFCASGSETNNTDRVITKINSVNGAVMVSSLILEFIESPWWGESYSDTESTVYIVEVSVLNNSWPLTKQEWGVVEPLRVNGENWRDSTTSLQSRRGGSDSRKKLTRMSKRAPSEQKTIENPFWSMQVLNDSSDTGDSIVIEEDKSFPESVKAMKMAWEEKDPGRRKRGREIRLKFLYLILIEERKTEWGESEDRYGETDWDSEKGGGDFQVLLERMTSFSYLTNDTSPTRYVQSPRKLPMTPLFHLLCKYCKVNPPVTSKSDEWDSCCEMSDNTQKSPKDVAVELDEDMKDFLNQCINFRSILLNHTNEEQKLSNQLMEEAYEGRLKAIERMMR